VLGWDCVRGFWRRKTPVAIGEFEKVLDKVPVDGDWCLPYGRHRKMPGNERSQLLRFCPDRQIQLLEPARDLRIEAHDM
jgi:hypothetical protein